MPKVGQLTLVSSYYTNMQLCVLKQHHLLLDLLCVIGLLLAQSSVDIISVTILHLVGAHFTNTWCCKGRQRRRLICACACAAAPLDRRRRRRVAFWPRKRRRWVGRSVGPRVASHWAQDITQGATQGAERGKRRLALLLVTFVILLHLVSFINVYTQKFIRNVRVTLN